MLAAQLGDVVAHLLSEEQDATGRGVERHGEAGTGTGGNQSMAMLI
jgi:hypothetical protein